MIAFLFVGIIVYSHRMDERQEVGKAATDLLAIQSTVTKQTLTREMIALRDSMIHVRRQFPPKEVAADPAAATKQLIALRIALALAARITIVDATGLEVASSAGETAETIVDHEEYFLTARAGADPSKLYLSKPFAFAPGRVAINATMVVTGPGGAFDGIVTATLDPNYLEEILGSVVNLPDMTTSLASHDGVTIVNVPRASEQLGTSVAEPGSVFSRHRASGQMMSAWSTFERTRDETRLTVTCDLTDPNLSTNGDLNHSISRNLADVEKEWRTRNLVWGLGCGFLLLALLLASIARRRHLEDKARIDAQLRRSEERYRSLFSETAVPMLLIDPDTAAIVDANKAAEDFYGWSVDTLKSMATTDIALTEREQALKLLRDSKNNDSHIQFESVHRRMDGRIRDVEITAGPVTVDDKILLLSFATDITEQKRDQERLVMLSKVFTHAREGIMITDANNEIIDINEAFTRITGYDRTEVLGKNPRILSSGRQTPEFYASLWNALAEDGYWSGEIWNRRKNGEFFAESLTISTFRDPHGKITNFVALFTDITMLKDHENELIRIAHYDSLTGLANRVLLADRLRLAIGQGLRRKLPIALIYLDLDGFKKINDTHGHDAGDALLIAVSKRMKAALRDGDTLARIGGDEFVAVLVDLADVRACEHALNRLLKAASDEVEVGDLKLRVSASIGVALSPQDGTEADQLMRQADQAMYVAKQSGKNRYHFFGAPKPDEAPKVDRDAKADA